MWSASTWTRAKWTLCAAASRTSRTSRPRAYAASCSAGGWSATTDFAALAGVDAVSICVPTPLNKTGDPGYVVHRVGQPTRWRSTCTPACWSSSSRPRTRAPRPKCCCPAEGSGVRASRSGSDFFLAFSPERVDPGQRGLRHADHARRSSAARRPPASRWRWPTTAAAIDTLVPGLLDARRPRWSSCWRTPSARSTSAWSTRCCSCADKLGLDAWEVIDAAATKPFGFMKFYPGPGPRRPLHPDRPALPVLEAEDAQLRRRASSSWPTRSTPTCRATGWRRCRTR